MDDKLVYIPNNDKQNFHFDRLELLVKNLDRHFKFEIDYLKFNKSNQSFNPTWL